LNVSNTLPEKIMLMALLPITCLVLIAAVANDTQVPEAADELAKVIK
jgi:hypothetical protein